MYVGVHGLRKNTFPKKLIRAHSEYFILSNNLIIIVIITVPPLGVQMDRVVNRELRNDSHFPSSILFPSSHFGPKR